MGVHESVLVATSPQLRKFQRQQHLVNFDFVNRTEAAAGSQDDASKIAIIPAAQHQNNRRLLAMLLEVGKESMSLPPAGDSGFGG